MKQKYRVGNRATKAYTRRLIQQQSYMKTERSGEKKAREKAKQHTGSTIAACRLFMKHSPMYMPFYKYRVVYTERRQAIAIFSLLLIYTHIFSFYIVLNDEFFCLPASTWMETFGTAACACCCLTLYHSFRLRELSELYIPSYIIIFSFFSLLLASWLAYSIPKSV